MWTQKVFQICCTRLQWIPSRSLTSSPLKIVREGTIPKVETLYKCCPTLDSAIAYLDTKPVIQNDDSLSDSEKEGMLHKPPCVFLHGNPTSSFIWRNILPITSTYSRCYAPDLMGMGKSGPIPSNSYRFLDHAAYLDEFFRKTFSPDEKITIIGHDWGSALAFYWAFRNQHRVHALVHMESIVSPMSYNEFPEEGRGIFQALRSPIGEDLIFHKNIFIENILPASILRTLDKEEFDIYKEPFLIDGRSRKPMLDWPRQIPIIEDGPDDVITIVQDYRRWLCTSEKPKLFVHACPGFFSSQVLKRVRHWRNHQVRKVRGHHFLQEDSPAEIADAIVQFLLSLEPGRSNL